LHISLIQCLLIIDVLKYIYWSEDIWCIDMTLKHYGKTWLQIKYCTKESKVEKYSQLYLPLLTIKKIKKSNRPSRMIIHLHLCYQNNILKLMRKILARCILLQMFHQVLVVGLPMCFLEISWNSICWMEVILKILLTLFLMGIWLHLLLKKNWKSIKVYYNVKYLLMSWYLITCHYLLSSLCVESIT
jgi:hypothetical protein